MQNGSRCPICGQNRAPKDLVSGRAVRAPIVELIQSEHTGWTQEQAICTADLRHYQLEYLEQMLQSERGALSELDREVLERIRDGETIAENVDTSEAAELTLGERVADRVASFGGSWTFITGFFTVLIAWILVNVFALLSEPFDPYPFILLNLVLSCLAAVQAPIIMMSQNRQEAKDRLRSEHDYQVNLKAELEVRLLHEKIDHLLLHEWGRLLETQRLQADMLDGIAERLDGRD